MLSMGCPTMETIENETNTFIEKATAILGPGYSFDKTFYRGTKKKVTITCDAHGDFSTLAANVLRYGTNCVACRREEAKQRFIAKAKEAHGDKFTYELVEFVNSTTPVKIVCREHGVFNAIPYSFPDRAFGCPECSMGHDRASTEYFVSKCREVHGDTYVYDKTEYLTEKDTVIIGCKQHGYFEQQARIHRMGSGCKKCFSERKRGNKKKFIEAARLVHGDKYCYSRVNYKMNKTKVEIICPRHGSFMVTPNSHLTNKSGCRKCRESKGETRIRVFLEHHGIAFRQEYTLPPHQYRFDFFLPTYRLLIEFHGQQHYMPVPIFGGKKELVGVKRRDAEKKRIAKEAGFDFAVLSYWHLKNQNLEIGLEALLRRKGHVFDKVTPS